MQNKIYSKIYGWMFIGLLISFITGYYVSTNDNMLYNIYTNASLPIILFLVEIGVVLAISAGLNKFSTMTLKILYVVYSLVTGVTLSTIFIAYRMDSIIYVFIVTSIMFAIMALIGHKTTIDITKIGTILLVGLLGIIIASLINLFIGSSSFDIMICIVGVIIFTIYIAYDVQVIKSQLETIEEDRLVIYGALQLYLDFINIFLKILRLFGKRND